jgi:fatty-acyl-CoA synthase
MQLCDYLDKGASLGPDAPCLTMAGLTRSYAEVQRLSWLVGRALARSGIQPGDKVAVLSGNDPVAFSSVFGIARAGAIWCPVNPRNEAAENRELLDLLDCSCLIYSAAFAPLVARIAADLPKLTTLVCLDTAAAGPRAAAGESDGSVPFRDWLAGLDGEPGADLAPAGAGPDGGNADASLVMIAGTGGTTGRPKGVMLTGGNLATMSALTLMSYPFEGRPVYLALAPLTHAAGVLCFPVLALGGEIIIMPAPDLGEFLALIGQHRVTHAFMPPTLIYMLLDHHGLAGADLSSLQCLWYGAAPMSSARLAEAIGKLGPVLGQLFGQTEAPMMISTMAPRDHLRPDGSLALERFASAGRPTPLTTVAIMDPAGALLPRGERGEIVVRGPLVMAGYYRNETATAEASAHGWHHTGDIGYLDAGNYLFIVDRAKDMIITGGFNVYSAEVEQALLQHPAVQDCAVVGLPDPKWGERVTAVIQLHAGHAADPVALTAFAKERLGSVKTPKQVEVWADLPRSRIGKVLKTEVKSRLLDRGQAEDPGAS